MKTEEKKLLLKDLCARLPYGIIASVRGSDEEFQHFHILGVKDDKVWVKNDILLVDSFDDVEVVKPYLRPMESMTEEEKKELKFETYPEGNGYFNEQYLICPMSHFGEYISYDFMSNILNWLNSKHFDYRGLIPMGLALPAKEGMYN